MRGRPVARCARIARTLAVAMAAAILGASALAQAPADKYPEKPIKIIVPFAPGGSVDILARVIGQKLTENWRQPVIVESRPGAGTMIGTQAAAKADPDGYTLIIVVSNHATNPALHATMPYDALKDFEPISLLARAPVVPYASPAFAPTNVKELVAAAKDKPGTINFGSAGPGFKLQTGIVMNHVVYRGGTPALNDVLAGQIPLTFATVTQALPQYQSGLVRALGVTAAARYASIPNVPTFREQGFDLVASEWYGLLAPAGTAKPIVAKLNAEMFKLQTGIVMNHVVYRGGTPALNDVLAGQIPLTFATVTQALPQYQSGLVRALGVTAAARYASIPNVPTFREQGFDLVASEWYGLLAPAGTAKPIVAKLNAEMRRIMALPNLGERLAAIELLSSSPEELSDFIRGEIDRWSPVIKKLDLKAE